MTVVTSQYQKPEGHWVGPGPSNSQGSHDSHLDPSSASPTGTHHSTHHSENLNLWAFKGCWSYKQNAAPGVGVVRACATSGICGVPLPARLRCQVQWQTPEAGECWGGPESILGPPALCVH